jgi:hypothetical protein
MAVDTVCVISAGHSGSTLLDMILGSHTDALSLGEISHFGEYVQDNRTCTCGHPVRSCPLWSQVLAQLEQMGHSAEQLSKRFVTVRRQPTDSFLTRTGHFASIAAFVVLPNGVNGRFVRVVAPETYRRASNIDRLYDLIRAASGRRLLVDSSKSVHRLRLLHALRPETTRAIFLTRDGRGVMASMMNRGGFSAEAAVDKWVRGQRYVLAMMRTLPCNTYLHVRYESLCRQSEDTVKGLADFLGLSFERNMLNFQEAVHHNIGGNRMRFENSERSIEESISWRQQLTDEELRLFEKRAGVMNCKLLGDCFVP